jgi:Domain of unknown function (DUF4279)
VDNQIQIDVTLSGFKCAPDDISRALAVQPDTALARGARHPALDLPKTSLWSKRSHHVAVDASLDQHWQTLATDLRGKEDVIVAHIGHGAVLITIIVDGTQRVPSLHIPADMVQFAAAVNASIDIDVYQD